MDINTALRLGRVSNLPTVWTNILAGGALAGVGLGLGAQVGLMLAASLFYVGGMFLNDAFDASVDARQRPERPIPSGDVDLRTVFLVGFGLLAAGELVLIVRAVTGDTGYMTALCGMLLAGLIVAYNANHKDNRFAPLLMGLCRALVYVLAGFAGEMAAGGGLFVGAGLVIVYLMGLTGVARQEHLGEMESMLPLILLVAPLGWIGAFEHPIGIGLYALFGVWVAFNGWRLTRTKEVKRNTGEDAAMVDALLSHSKDPDVRRLSNRPPAMASSIPPAGVLPSADSMSPPSSAPPPAKRPRDPEIGAVVGGLIAGIALVDGVFVASSGNTPGALFCVGCFALTLVLQRVVPGT